MKAIKLYILRVLYCYAWLVVGIFLIGGPAQFFVYLKSKARYQATKLIDGTTETMKENAPVADEPADELLPMPVYEEEDGRWL